MTTALLQ